MKFSYKVLSSAAVAGIIASIPMVAHAANGDFYNQTKKLQYSRADLLASKDLQKTLQAQLDAKDIILKESDDKDGVASYLDYQKASDSFLKNFIISHDAKDAIAKAVVEGKIIPTDDPKTYPQVKSLAVNSVSNITKTSFEVKLATGVNQDAAKLATSYAVKNGDADVTVSKVDYNSALNVATITADLDGKDGKLTVNGVSSDSFDFKAPTISKITPMSLTKFKVEFNEALNSDSVAKASYVVVQGANVFNVTAQLGTDNKTVYFTTTADLTEGATYTFGVKGIKDTALNEVKDQITSTFTAVKDSTAPTIAGVKALDSNKIEITMSEPVVATEAISTKFAAYGADGKLGTAIAGTPTITKEGTLADGKPFGTKIVVSIDGGVDDANLLVNGTNYNIVLAGVKDLADLSIADKANADFVGVRDVVPPTVTSSTYKDGKLNVTFSEAVKNADIKTNYVVYNKNTGVKIDSPASATVQPDGVTYALDLSGLSLTASTDYSVVLNGITDAANKPNALKANTVLTFTTPQAEVKAAEVSSAKSASGTTVSIAFSNPVSATEAETIANYSIVKTDDSSVSLAVKKAVYDSKTNTVTLTTDAQTGANYTVTVSNISNLTAGKNTAKFDSTDVVAPAFAGVNVINDKVVDLTFNEALTGVPDTITIIKSGDVDAITPTSKTLLTDGKTVRLVFDTKDNLLTSGSTYIVAVTGAKDKATNASVKQTKTFVAGAADTTAAKLTGVKVDSSTQIELQFDKELDVASVPTLTLTVGDKDAVDLSKYATVKGSVVTVKTAESMFSNGDSCTVKVTGGVKDLAGNTTTDASATFTGTVDSVGPKLVSAAAGKTDDTVVLTFDKALDNTFTTNEAGQKVYNLPLVPGDFTVTNADTFETLTVTGVKYDDTDSKLIDLTVSGMKAGVNYKVYVGAKVGNTEVGANQGFITDANRTATFTGIDTTAPTLDTVTLSGATAVVDKDKDEINITLDKGTTTISSGSIALSEDVNATFDAKDDSYDIVNPVTITKSMNGQDIIKLINGIYGKSSVSSATLIKNDGSTLTLKDAAGNKTVYTLKVTQAQ